MFNWKKEITPEIIEEEEKEITIHLDTEQFKDYVIEYETGTLKSDEVLILFCYIIQKGKWGRFSYPWLIELMDHRVLTQDGYVNPYELKIYRDTKIKTKIKF